ncbi:SAM-dependent methyltransferase [Shewanella aquimarina]|uniref:SAM-dependent methyltransferase n=1 Tax=Shewanella aquimarina TaxID=260365 RepID=UPI002014DAF7|nr:cyclopropane-fatty-acyl-phospholipid synthase family protein [Shewanella aquimarina]MCL2910107.1 cyclopropane-fatty-acyl-phospholipid synthase family protein [Shewanella aquimarina]
MEQIIKQENGVKPRGAAVNEAVKRGAKPRYRALVLRLLEQLQGGRITLVESDTRQQFGELTSGLNAEIVVLDPSFYRDLIQGGSIGAAEAFLDGKWTSPDLTLLIQLMARNQTRLDALEQKVAWLTRIKHLFLRLSQRNTEQGAKRNILAHYDIGNELYERFLDSSMLYSCALYDEAAQSLAQAQQNKLRTICDKLELKPGEHVLEIGTGWGALAIYMAQHYGCQVTTTTISDAQYQYAKTRIEEAGLSEQITLLKQDYRRLTGQYDKLVSIEMIEAVGHEYLGTFFETCSKRLKQDGKMLLQAITISDGRYDKYRRGVDFIQKYIFPGGCLPSVAVMSEQIAKRTDMVICDLQDIGLHYARTLYDWRQAFEQAWPQLEALGYDASFKRLWLFYFCYCEGAFKERLIATHHLVARKPRYFGAQDESVLAY